MPTLRRCPSVVQHGNMVFSGLNGMGFVRWNHGNSVHEHPSVCDQSQNGKVRGIFPEMPGGRHHSEGTGFGQELAFSTQQTDQFRLSIRSPAWAMPTNSGITMATYQIAYLIAVLAMFGMKRRVF